MNERQLVKIAGNLDSEAARILGAVPGVAVEARPRRREPPDAVVQFGGATEPIAIEAKSYANAATAWRVVQEARGVPDGRVLLVAGDTTAEAREILERHGVAFVDGLGNAHVELPGLLLHLEGRRRRRGDARRVHVPTRLTGKGGIAVQALLLEADRAWRVQDLAEAAHLSVGMAHRVLTRLEAERLVAAEGAGPKRVRHVVARTALLDLWAEENRDRSVERVRAFRLAREPRELVDAVSGGLQAAGIEHAVTGAAAAARLAPFVTAVPVAEIWVGAIASLEDVAAATDSEVADTGHNLAFAQTKGDEPLAFRRTVDRISVVNPFRLFYDLRRDPRRGREQADALRREVIGF